MLSYAVGISFAEDRREREREKDNYVILHQGMVLPFSGYKEEVKKMKTVIIFEVLLSACNASLGKCSH